MKYNLMCTKVVEVCITGHWFELIVNFIIKSMPFMTSFTLYYRLRETEIINKIKKILFVNKILPLFWKNFRKRSFL